jgi:hypothetical protein
MKTSDLGSSLFWLVFSISVCVESLRLGIGTLHNPGMGFWAFGASGLLVILSLSLFFQAVLRKGEAEIHSIFSGLLWKRVILVLIALLVYAKLMPVVGYLISTFLLMSFLFWIVRGQKWWWVLVFSFLSTLITYLVFSVWLKGQYPEGLLGG